MLIMNSKTLKMNSKMLNAKEGLWNRGLRQYANTNTMHVICIVIVKANFVYFMTGLIF